MPPKKSQKRKRAPKTKAVAPPSFVLSKEDQEAVKEAFDAYADVGTLSVKRAKHALREALDITISKDEIRVDNGDTLDWSDFIRFATSKQRQQIKAELAFSLLDTDGKGFLSIEDVARTAAELGEEFSQEEMEEMMQEADPSGEGLVVDGDALFRVVRKVKL